MSVSYRTLHNTETALLRVQHDIATTLDQNRAVFLVMLDFSSAFDTIDQGQLLHLLETDYGVAGTALSWFRTYREGRTQRIQIDSEMSDHIPLHFGVPQASVLGPVIFTLYTAPMQVLYVSMELSTISMQMISSFTPFFILASQEIGSGQWSC